MLLAHSSRTSVLQYWTRDYVPLLNADAGVDYPCRLPLCKLPRLPSRTGVAKMKREGHAQDNEPTGWQITKLI